MKKITLSIILSLFAFIGIQAQPADCQQQKKVQPIQMILDSDFGSSTDDLFALMMLHHYIDEGLVDLKGIIVDREGEKNAGIVDIFDNYYGHPDIPVGLERNGVKNPRCFIPYNGICDLKDAQGNPLFKRSLDASKLPDGYKLYRKILSKAEDNSIVVVAIGFATTLSQLFESGSDEYSSLSGLDLFKQKVKAVYIQSGRFEAGDSLSGYNMRAASKQSAVFYSKLPEKVDLIMSPSNIGDKMNYLPQDVVADLSYTDWNPIKAVYTNYTCDTGQRMWDTNCLVQAVFGDNAYHLSPRGWVTFIDKGEMSEMLFKPDPDGNARYQMPGDSYFFEEKLMDIRRHNRINKYPSRYTIEAPQPTLLSGAATEWAKPRMGLLIDKYLATAGNKLDPDEFRQVFQPIGYYGGNILAYREAEKMIVDSLYTVMLDRAIRNGKNTMTIITGAPGSGKSTAARQLNLKGEGLIYDAALSGGTARLDNVIQRAKAKGINKITVMLVYNDILTCYTNSINRGKNSNRFCTIDYLMQSFEDNKGKIEWLQKQHPDVTVIPVTCEGNKGPRKVTIEEAKKWDYDVSEEEVNQMMSTLLDVVNSGELWEQQLPSLVGDIMATPNLSARNKKLAKEISDRVDELVHNRH
jgi:Superfamily I DNA and RNA helicases